MVILICLVISLIEIKNTFSFFLKLRDEKDYYIYTEEFVIESLAKETGLIKENDLEFKGIDFYPDPHSYSSLEAFNALENLLKIQEINYVQLRFFCIKRL